MLTADSANVPFPPKRQARRGASDRWRGHATLSLLLSPALFVVLRIGLQAGERLGEGAKEARRLPVQHAPTNGCTRHAVVPRCLCSRPRSA